MSDFKKQVRIKLIERDMNMVDLARELEITPSYLSELLNGTRTNQDQINRIKEYLEIGGD